MAASPRSPWSAMLAALAAGIAMVVTIVPPAVCFALLHQHEKTAIDVDAQNVAQNITNLINRDPEYWQFQQYVLDNHVAMRRIGYPVEQRVIRNEQGQVLAESLSHLQFPLISSVQPLFNAGRKAGELEIVRTLRPVIRDTAVVSVFSLVFGALVFFIMKTMPLRALNQAFARLHEEKERAQTTLDSIGDAVITTDAKMRVEYLNPVAEQLTGWSTAEVVGRPMEEIFNIVNETTREKVLNPIQTALAENRIVEMANHTILIRRDGTEFHIEDSAAPVRSMNGHVVGAVMVFHDVTDRKATQRNLDHMAHHDGLTGLPNRAMFNQRLQQALARSVRKNEAVTLMFIDLDRFKTINDSLGHLIGDQVLLVTAERLRQSVRMEDMVARLGGDEFTIILEGVGQAESAATVAQKILDELMQPFVVEGQQLFISASIGIAVSSNDATDPSTLLRNADTAMYRAKELGRNTYQFYEAGMNQAIVERLHIENDLRHALATSQFTLHYQPKLNLKTNQVDGVEALLRWKHPERGMVMPATFIPVLEETGFIVEVGEWIIREACRQAKAWREQGYHLRIAVNVSAKQLQAKHFVEFVTTVLQETGLTGEALEFEITESVFLSDTERTESILKELRAKHIPISLDDFGIGYSALGYLKRFPLDKLKIDKTFIDDLTNGQNDQALVQGVIVMAHALSMEVVAEGVETLDQLEMLRQIGSDVAQGYFISRPLNATDLLDWLNKHRLASQSVNESSSKEAVLVL